MQSHTRIIELQCPFGSAAALASEASGQRGHFYKCARIARRKTRVNALVTLA